MVSQFAKLAAEDIKDKNSEETVYGTVVTHNNTKYVKLDGSDVLTPVSSTTEIVDKDRVMVLVKNHTAVVTGNITTPAASSVVVKDAFNKIGEFNTVLAKKADIDELDAQIGRIDELIAENATIKGTLSASEAEIKKIQADNITINKTLTANDAAIKKLQTEKLDVDIAEITYATVENFKATDAELTNLKSEHGSFKDLTTKNFESQSGLIKKLQTDKLDTSVADITYANIDFTNIGTAAMEYFYSKSGLISNVTIGDETITGELVGVTIKGDLIQANSLIADKLVIKGDDGLYYKLNTDGMTVEKDQTDKNSLNGNIIMAKSITATKINVHDLVAFGADIAGFKIDDSAIHSVGKNSIDSGVRGTYLSKDGQMMLGDPNQYLKYFKDTDGTYKLAICAGSIELSSGLNIETKMDEVTEKIEGIKSVKETLITYQVGTSGTSAPTGDWTTVIPTVKEGQYLWTRTITIYTDDTSATAYSVSSMGEKGDPGSDGHDAVTLKILSNKGNIFKNNSGEIELTAHVYKGGVEQAVSSTGVVSGIGTVHWYNQNGTLVGAYKSIKVNATQVDGMTSYKAELS